jgi:site-specific recombinase XerD
MALQTQTALQVPMSSLRLPKAFSADELSRLLTAAHKMGRGDVHALIRLLLATGLRSAEVLQIRTEMVTAWPKPRRLRRFRPETFTVIGKGDKERVVLASRAAVGAARDLLAYSKGPQLVPFSDRGMRYVIARVGEAAGVAHAHPHRFRHSFASEHVEAGTPLHVLADMMGHASLDVTRLYFSSSVTARLKAERGRARRSA